MEKVTNRDADNINTKKYWENRFGTGDWENKGGRAQTASFANAQAVRFHFNKSFDGVIVDFGCGLGDAIPVYHHFYPSAILIGLDVSVSAIEKCKTSHGHLAKFIHGTHQECPIADIIVASNVFEHLSEDINIAKDLLYKCHQLFITVPYKEDPLCSEHIRSYDENYFQSLGKYEYEIFPSPGWSEYGFGYIKLGVKNILRLVTGHNMRPRRLQIMFRFQGLRK